MSEPAKTPNPFDLLIEQIREVVREEIKAAGGNGNGRGALLTAEQLAKALQVNKATVYDWVRSNSTPYYQAGRFVHFSLREVLQSQKKKNDDPLDRA